MVFFYYYKNTIAKWNRERHTIKPNYNKTKLIWKLIFFSKKENLRKFITDLFYHKPIDGITRISMFKCISYYLYPMVEVDDLNNKQKTKVENVVNKMEQKIGNTLNRSEDELPFIKQQEGEISFAYFPVGVKVIIGGVSFIMKRYLESRQFRHKLCDNKLEIWHFNKPNRKTILILHGLGIGITPYIPLAIKLSKYYNVVMPELETIAIQKILPQKTDYLENIYSGLIDYLSERNVNDINIVAHSFGTFKTVAFLNACQDNAKVRIKKKILIDPVCFWIDPIKTGRFSYFNLSKIFLEENAKYNLKKLYTLSQNYVFCNDINVQYICKRLLRPTVSYELGDNIDNNTLILLGYNDNFVNSDEILRYCRRKWKDVNIMIKNYEHGIWLKELTNNVKIIRDFMDVEKIEK